MFPLQPEASSLGKFECINIVSYTFCYTFDLTPAVNLRSGKIFDELVWTTIEKNTKLGVDSAQQINGNTNSSPTYKHNVPYPQWLRKKIYSLCWNSWCL